MEKIKFTFKRGDKGSFKSGYGYIIDGKIFLPITLEGDKKEIVDGKEVFRHWSMNTIEVYDVMYLKQKNTGAYDNAIFWNHFYTKNDGTEGSVACTLFFRYEKEAE